jgi:hypothetical protein
VTTYAIELSDNLRSDTNYVAVTTADTALLHQHLLSGADSWQRYSEGGSSLCYNDDIAERLLPPAALAKWLRTRPERPWLEDQARALCQAHRLIRTLIRYEDSIALRMEAMQNNS